MNRFQMLSYTAEDRRKERPVECFVAEEGYQHSCETKHQQGYEDVSYPFPTNEPFSVAPSDCLDSAPETVGKMEPEGTEPNKVQQNEVPLREGKADEIHAISGNASS